VLTGEITYPEQVGEDSPADRTGTLVVVKATLDRRVPYPVLCYAADNPTFPHDSTGDQWFDHRQFDAYQTLGRHLGERAAALGGRAGWVGNGRSSARSYRA